MSLLRRLTCISVTHNFILQAAHVPDIADSLTFFFPEIQIVGSRCRPPSDSSSSPFTNDLPVDHPLHNLVNFENSSSKVYHSTLPSYRTAWKHFHSFHTTYNLPFPSLDLITITSYISFSHSSRNMHLSTIRVYLSGINFMTKLVTGAPHPHAQHSQVTLLLKGLKRNEPPNDPSRQPITSDILAGCITTLWKPCSS